MRRRLVYRQLFGPIQVKGLPFTQRVCPLMPAGTRADPFLDREARRLRAPGGLRWPPPAKRRIRPGALDASAIP